MEITLQERMKLLQAVFDYLQSTNSRILKVQIVEQTKKSYPWLVDDLNYIFETLDGRHPIGWTFRSKSGDCKLEFNDVTSVIKYLENARDHRYETLWEMETNLGNYCGDFIAPIVNRELKLGLAKSMLEKSSIAPMLAKKFEGSRLLGEYIVTEKLDGNRCIASYDTDKKAWCFTSRSGKPLHVLFDMGELPTDRVYDGEIMSIEQTFLSLERTLGLKDDESVQISKKDAQLQFNETSGIINSKLTSAASKNLIYNIFDIVSPVPYYIRRKALTDFQEHCKLSPDIRIVPVLYIGSDVSQIDKLLLQITDLGGEGLMLNDACRKYENKRTDALLKYKIVQTMDMEVYGTVPGTGKYKNLVGALQAKLITLDGKHIACEVGSGLSDTQRYRWALHPEEIVGKIIQVGYHELTQDRHLAGSTWYSVRFPRLICIRNDKTSTSEF